MGRKFTHDVFLSHSSKDKDAVRELAERLRGDGLTVWFDEWEIHPGDQIGLAIEKGLEGSRTLILVMSKSAFASEWITLERHTALFRDPTNKDRRFIPLRLDDATINDVLKQFRYIDWREPSDEQYAELFASCGGASAVEKAAPSEVEGQTHPCPFPGLRPFRASESDYFFGREEDIERLLMRLKHSRFLAVLGPSGSGKSSLVHAGLLPAMESSLAHQGGSWRTAIMRPGDSPYENLAKALFERDANGKEPASDQIAIGALQRTLETEYAKAFVETVGRPGLPPKSTFVLVVDQFEEIFRYGVSKGASSMRLTEAKKFVDMLLEVATDTDSRGRRPSVSAIYVIITMRWDFLHEKFHSTGLTEVLNESVFFIPPLTRLQKQDAIVGPARHFGVEIDGPVVEHLLNETEGDDDGLPLLQHTMMRIWCHAEKRSGSPPNRLTREDYEAVGSCIRALSNHADKVYLQCDNGQRRVAERVFKCLCDRSTGRRDARRPTKLTDLASIADVSCDEVMAVVDRFRDPECNFLVLSASEQLGENAIVDISHECLLRKWRRLVVWADDEAQVRDTYRRALGAAHTGKPEDIWRVADLDKTLAWLQTDEPNVAWARHIGSNEDEFDLVRGFLRTNS